MIPDPPKFSADDMQRCRDTGDYKSIMFEWYKLVGSLCFTMAFIKPYSPSYRLIPAQHYYVLSGLMNRCARLMLSNVALSHEGKFGETTAIVDRCIFESAIKVMWLCHSGSDEEFRRYIADGLKTELELKGKINEAIAKNGGISLPIEDRMLRSIARHIDASGMTETEIKGTKNIRNLASMLEALNIDRLIYVVAQKIGSHHVHGTWPSLLIHYLEKRDDPAAFIFLPNANHISTHINQYMFTPMIVLDAMRAFVAYVLEDNEADAFADLFGLTERDILAIYAEAGEDAQ
jgi:Family of unknown function (DUF5677)